MDDGYTKEEWKMVAETKKILDPAIKVTATCVRVPVFVGHAEALNIEFERPITEEQARKALAAQPGCIVVDHRANEGYVTPAECAGEDAVYVSRIRSDPTIDRKSTRLNSSHKCASRMPASARKKKITRKKYTYKCHKLKKKKYKS